MKKRGGKHPGNCKMGCNVKEMHLLVAIYQYQKEHLRVASQRELEKEFSYSMNSISTRVKNLRALGYLMPSGKYLLTETGTDLVVNYLAALSKCPLCGSPN